MPGGTLPYRLSLLSYGGCYISSRTNWYTGHNLPWCIYNSEWSDRGKRYPRHCLVGYDMGQTDVGIQTHSYGRFLWMFCSSSLLLLTLHAGGALLFDCACPALCCDNLCFPSARLNSTVSFRALIQTKISNPIRVLKQNPVIYWFTMVSCITGDAYVSHTYTCASTVWNDSLLIRFDFSCNRMVWCEKNKMVRISSHIADLEQIGQVRGALVFCARCECQNVFRPDTSKWRPVHRFCTFRTVYMFLENGFRK